MNQDKVPVISFRPGGQFDFEVEYTNTSGNDSLYLVSSREGINKVIELKWDVKKKNTFILATLTKKILIMFLVK